MDCGDIKKSDYYNIMSKVAPLISQKILERKVNQKNKSEENIEIIEYFKKTEEFFEENNSNLDQPKFSDIFESINEDEKIKNIIQNELFEYIEKVKNKTEDIIKKIQGKESTNEKKNLEKLIMKVYPEFKEEMEKLRNKENIANKDNNLKNIVNIYYKSKQKKSKELIQDKDIKNGIPEITKIYYDFQKEKEKYDNILSYNNINIIKKDFTNGYHEKIVSKFNHMLH